MGPARPYHQQDLADQQDLGVLRGLYHLEGLADRWDGGAGWTDYTRIFIFAVATVTFLAAELRIMAVVLGTALTVVAKAVACASRKRILSAHKLPPC